jgi:hypothetical protein
MKHSAGLCVALLFVFLVGLVPSGLASDRTDIIVLKNGDRVTGQIRRMQYGILDVKCDWGDSSLKIYWDQVKHIESDRMLSIELSAGGRFRGTLEKKADGSEGLVIRDQEGSKEELRLSEIAYLHEGVGGPRGRIDGSLDVGYSLAKSNSTQQLTANGTLIYETEKWVSISRASALFAGQTGANDTQRYSIDSGLKRVMRNNWFLAGGIDFLHSTELQMDLRSVALGGIGRYFRRDSKHLFYVLGGAAWNNENYSDPEIPNQNTPELTGSTAYNLYNLLGDNLNLINQFSAYKSLTQGSRFRFDIDLELRWSLPKHLYFNVTFKDNYDSSPIGDTPKNDYLFTTGFGWSP